MDISSGQDSQVTKSDHLVRSEYDCIFPLWEWLRDSPRFNVSFQCPVHRIKT